MQIHGSLNAEKPVEVEVMQHPNGGGGHAYHGHLCPVLFWKILKWPWYLNWKTLEAASMLGVDTGHRRHLR